MAARFSTGLRNKMTGANSYPKNLYSATTISFGDGTGTGGNDQILDSANGLVTAGFVVGDYVTNASASTTNDASGLKALVVAAGAIDVAAGSFSTEDAATAGRVILGAGMNGGSLDELLRDGVIEVYSGAQPSDADSAETGTKLLRVTLASGAFTPGSPTNGLNLGTAASGAVSKESAEVWSGVGLAAGTAGWFRFYSNAYTTGASTSAVRFDGVCGVGSGELRLSSLSVAVGATITVDSGSITQPANA
jgi:hypothetical protein